MKPKLLEDIFTELIAVYENLKAEVLIAEIQENSAMGSDDFIIANQSTFSRSYRRDIINVDNLLNDDKLTFNLSRNGLYDTLPEGLFHYQATSGKSDNSYLARRKTVKQEEQDARSFFAPLENEFFYQKLSIESHERELLDDFYNLNDNFLIDFWNIDDTIPEDYLLKLIKLLPYSHKIAGDLELTRLSLERILGEKICLKKKYTNQSNTIKNNKNPARQNDLQLGVDTVLQGNSNQILDPILEITIGPISENNLNKYLKKDGVIKFINTFYDYFIPLEYDVITNFVVNKEDGFLLDEKNGAIMGISTQL